MTRRMLAAVLALGGVFLSVYLLLYALGVYGELVCGVGGGCDVVQASKYSRLLGVPVAGWGLAWYAAVFLVAFLSVQGRFAEEKWPGRSLLVLAAGGLAFSFYLTAIELFVLHAICRWCVASAILTVLIFVAALPWGGSASGGSSPESLESGPIP
jgi:uncharacterized membrane protein